MITYGRTERLLCHITLVNHINLFYHKSKTRPQLLYPAFILLSGSRADSDTCPVSVFAVILVHPVLLLVMSIGRVVRPTLELRDGDLGRHYRKRGFGLSVAIWLRN